MTDHDDQPCKFPGECTTFKGDHCERCYGRRRLSPEDEAWARAALEHAKRTPSGWLRQGRA